MQPRDIERLDAHYANEKGFAEFAAKKRLHEATIQVNKIVRQRGRHYNVTGIPPRIYAMLCLNDPYVAFESFFETTLLPQHDTFITPDGKTIPSRLLVVDARNPLHEKNANEMDPRMRNRAYFVVFGESINKPNDVLPYFVVSEREVTAKGTLEQQLHHVDSTVFYSAADAWPLHGGREPERIHDPEPYAMMAAELELAVATLSNEQQ